MRLDISVQFIADRKEIYVVIDELKHSELFVNIRLLWIRFAVIKTNQNPQIKT